MNGGDAPGGNDITGENVDCGPLFGPDSYETGDTEPAIHTLDTCNGVGFEKSEVGLQHISDGTSNTYLIGEKYLDPQEYETGVAWGDDACYFTGVDHDNMRWADDFPAQDQLGQQAPEIWGSSHPGIFHMVMCDASVQALSFDTDLDIHRRLANRRDGQPVGLE